MVRWLIAVLLVPPLLVRPAGAQEHVCDHFGTTLRGFAVIAGQMQTKVGPSQSPGESWGCGIVGPACTVEARLAATYVDPMTSMPGLALVATATDGVAARFTRGTINFSTGWNHVYGDLVTGGGSVKGIDPQQDVDGTVDTSGTNPAVAQCRQAMVDAQAASDFYASQPAARDLGSLTIPRFTTYSIDAAPDEIIHIAALDVQGGFDPQSPSLCYHETTLDLTGGPAVINVDRLELGPCVFVSGNAIILNVAGSGRPIHVGRGDAIEAALLAPGRSISLRGTLDDQGSYLFFVAGARVKTTGLSSTGTRFRGCG